MDEGGGSTALSLSNGTPEPDVVSELAQAQILRSVDLLDAIFQSLADGVAVLDKNGRVVYANDAAAHAMGYPSVATLVHAPQPVDLESYEILDEDGRPVEMERLPSRQVLQWASYVCGLYPSHL